MQNVLKGVGFLTLILVGGVSAQIQLETSSSARSADQRFAAVLAARLRNTHVDVDIEDEDLETALKRLGKLARVQVILSRAIEDHREAPVTLKLEAVRLGAALSILAERFDLGFLVQRCILTITTKEEAWKRAMVLSIHSVHDMLYVPPDFPAPDINIRPSNVEPRPTGGEVIEREQKDPERLVDLLRNATGGDAVWDAEGASLELHRGKLFVRHAPSVQLKVRRMLGRLRGMF